MRSVHMPKYNRGSETNLVSGCTRYIFGGEGGGYNCYARRESRKDKRKRGISCCHRDSNIMFVLLIRMIPIQ